MAEQYPSDSTLNALTQDALSGVEYIDTGQAPYYLQFRKLLQRLLLSMAKAADLRVFDEGDIDVGVKAGKFFDGTTLRSYAGSTGNTLTDDDTNYVYVNSAGTLVTNVTGYPALSTNHIRLATVVCASGDITSITDDRGQHNWSAPGGFATGAIADTLHATEGGLPFILKATLTAGSTVAIHTTDAPFKFHVIDAWSIATSADGGTWKVTNGTNDITDAVTVTGTDKTINKAGTIDDGYNEIDENESLSVVGDGANADCVVYVMCVRES